MNPEGQGWQMVLKTSVLDKVRATAHEEQVVRQAMGLI